MAITKKLRFEIFKRDGFKCQYCGRKVPDVVLEVDHITPKFEKGIDDISNLITSCFDCNRGKGKNKIDKICRDDIDYLNEKIKNKREQLIEYNKYLKKEENSINNDVDEIEKYYCSLTYKSSLTLHDKLSYKQFLKIFTIQKIKEALEIGYVKKVNNIVTYSFGILHNWRKTNNQK